MQPLYAELSPIAHLLENKSPEYLTLLNKVTTKFPQLLSCDETFIKESLLELNDEQLKVLITIDPKMPAIIGFDDQPSNSILMSAVLSRLISKGIPGTNLIVAYANIKNTISGGITKQNISQQSVKSFGVEHINQIKSILEVFKLLGIKSLLLLDQDLKDLGSDQFKDGLSLMVGAMKIDPDTQTAFFTSNVRKKSDRGMSVEDIAAQYGQFLDKKIPVHEKLGLHGNYTDLENSILELYTLCINLMNPVEN